MAEERRVTIRLTPDLYAQLEACGSHGQPLAAIVRQALLEYVARQPETPPAVPDMALMLAALAARLDALQDQVEALTAQVETLAATRQPQAAMADADRQPAADVAAAPLAPARPRRGRRQLTPRQVRALRDKHLRGVPVPALMEEYGLSRASVFRYLRSPQRRESPPTAADTTPPGAATPGRTRRTGRPPGPLRQQILALLQAHPEGLRAEEIRVYVQTPRPIGDTLQGMLKGGVITVQGRGTERRYVATAPSQHDDT
jgi:hypothetical protein